MLAQLGVVAMGTVDLIMVGRVGDVALAAVGLGNAWSFGGAVLGLGFATGLDPFLARAYGAGRPREAGRAALHGAAWIALVCVLLIAQHLLAGPALRLLGQPAEVVPVAALYSGILALGLPAMLAFAVVRQLLQGSGTMRPAMWVIGLGNIVNLVGDLVAVGVFDLGVPGVAAVTALVQWVMLVALVALTRPLLRQAWPGWGWSASLFWAVGGRASPVALQIGFEVWAFNAASIVAGLLGTVALAAHAAALSASSVAFMIPLGISAAAATRIGNLTGADRPWRPAGWAAVGLGAVAMLPSSALFALAPSAVARVYAEDAAVVAAAAAVLPIAAGFAVFDGVQVVAMGVLRGLGDTRWPAMMAIVAYWAIALPVGAWLSGTRGLEGLWLGLAIGLGLAAVLLFGRIRSSPEHPLR